MDVEEYLNDLKSGIDKTFKCQSRHVKTVPVKAVFNDKVAWEGEVEVFDLIGHAQARRCYAWGIRWGHGDLEITNVLGIPPVVSPETAVMAAIASASKGTQE
jgi:hypothetical protein